MPAPNAGRPATQRTTLRLSDLHPAIAEAAEAGWRRNDYGQAVRDAWFALRDMLRERLEEPELDGAALVNAIGEDKEPVRLPLTEYVTTSERNKHRGLVNFLRGIVFYVRNPDAHETDVATSRVAAFERLAVMSLCARHVETAARPTAVEDAVTELTQQRFELSGSAMREIIESVPARRRGELAQALLDAARAAHERGDTGEVDAVRRAYPLALHYEDPALLTNSARACGELIARDETFDLGVMLLPRSAFPLLTRARRERVSSELVSQARNRTAASPGSDLAQELGYLFPVLDADTRERITGALAERLSGASPLDAHWAFRAACQTAGQLTRRENGVLAQAMAAFVERDGADEDVRHVRFLLEEEPDFRDSELRQALQEKLEASESAQVEGSAAHAVLLLLRARPGRPPKPPD